MIVRYFIAGMAASLVAVSAGRAAENDPFSKIETPAIAGCWDLTVHGTESEYPSWLCLELSGYRTLVGAYVGRFGSARPISSIEFGKDHFRFVVPPQWEHTTNDIVCEGTLEGDVLKGRTTDENGRFIPWEARRAPTMYRTGPHSWGKSVALFNGRNLEGWKPRNPAVSNGWRVVNGLLTNVKPGNDLITENRFTDFKLLASFRYPKQSNSGIYLRGRYEVQIEDDFGKEPSRDGIGGVYGFLKPRVNAAKKAGEWQTLKVTLVGREITVVLNGETIIERQAIPGITGGALDSAEGEPGPIMIQGDHGQVEFKELVLTPLKPRSKAK